MCYYSTGAIVVFRMNAMLTETEKMIISIIVMDDEIGSFFIFPRSKDYWNIRNEIQNALKIDAENSNKLDKRQKLLIEEYYFCVNQIEKSKNENLQK